MVAASHTPRYPGLEPVNRGTSSTAYGVHLFDHPRRLHQYCTRDLEAERLGGLHIDHQIEHQRLLDRQIGWFSAFQDLVDVRRGATEDVETVDPVAHEAACIDVLLRREYRWQPVL